MIRKLSKQEFENTFKRPLGKKSLVRTYIESLEIGESFKIDRSDWHVRHKSPAYACRNVERGSRKRFKAYLVMDKSGWIIERVK